MQVAELAGLAAGAAGAAEGAELFAVFARKNVGLGVRAVGHDQGASSCLAAAGTRWHLVTIQFSSLPPTSKNTSDNTQSVP